MVAMTDGNVAADEQNGLVHFRSLMAQELRTLETDELLSRYRFARSVGATFGGKRDLYQILGYEELLTVDHYRERYERGGLAGTVVDILPDATWRAGFELVEDEQALQEREYTAFEMQWQELVDRVPVPSRLHQADILSRLSTYSVLLIGGPGGELDTPLPQGNGTPAAITNLQPFVGAGGWRMSGMRPSRNRLRAAVSDQGGDATIKTWVENVKDPRFGLPATYGLKRTEFSSQLNYKDVHWSRVIHLAEGTLDDDVFGRPVLARPWNLFDDLDKVAGGGAEAFWLRANRGLHLDVAKEIQTLADDEKKDIKDQVERYIHELTRVIRSRGVTIKELGSDVANFANPGDFIISLIAGTVRVPKRILVGSEQAELASTQDRETFRDQVQGRRTGYVTPRVIKQLVNRLIDFNYLVKPKQYAVRWPKEEILTEAERSQGAESWARINASMGVEVFTADEIRDRWYGMKPIVNPKPLPSKPQPKEDPNAAAE